jgi:hypothetical protein
MLVIFLMSVLEFHHFCYSMAHHSMASVQWLGRWHHGSFAHCGLQKQYAGWDIPVPQQILHGLTWFETLTTLVGRLATDHLSLGTA